MMTDYFDFFNIYIIGSVEMLFQFHFFTKFLNKKVTLPFYFLFIICAGIVLHFFLDSTIISLAVFSLLLVAWGVTLCRADLKSSILYAALVVEVMQLCYGIVRSLFYMLMMLFAAYEVSGIIFMLACEIASLIFTGVCYNIVYRHFSYYNAAEYMFLVLIPILMLFIMDDYVNAITYSLAYINSSGTAEFLRNHGQTLIIQVLGIVSLFCILFAHKKLLQSFQLCTELSLLEQKEHSLNQYVEEARSHYEKTKSFRHDIRNHITVVKELLQAGKTEQAIQYIGNMDEIAEELLFPCSTNNPVVDILVGNKLGVASSMGIDVSCTLLLPNPCGLRDIDICIILSNALDNAFRACKDVETEKYIHISGRIQGDFLMIVVENSYQGTDSFKKGIGLSNIETVAEKYHGAMLAEKSGGRFSLSVLLNIS